MQVYISNREICEIAEGIVSGAEAKRTSCSVDIDRIAEYLGITVIYEHFAETDLDKIGFAADGKAALAVWRDGKIVSMVFPKNTVVLEQILLLPQEETRRRFTLAHEIGHILLMRADPARMAACFNRVYDGERQYTLEGMRERMNLNECQANTMAAYLLMPRSLVEAAVRQYAGNTGIRVYGDCVFEPETKPVLRKMAEFLNVSYTALVIQLRKYGMLEQRDIREYICKTMKNGGCRDE